MSVEITSGNNAASTDFLVQQQAQQRDARFQEMPQMDGAGYRQPQGQPGQSTGVPGGPATGRHIGSAARPGSSQALLMRKQMEQRQAMANAPPVVHQLRARMDDKNTDRYYRAAEVSAIGPQSPDGSTMAPGQTRPAPNTFRSGQLRQLDERNTDRYYRDQLERGMTKQQIEQHNLRRQHPPLHQPPLPPQGSQTQPVQHAQAVHPLEIRTRDDIRVVLEQAAQLVLNGATRVVVRVTGPQSLYLPAQTILDGLVPKMILTEDQARDIKIDLSQVGTADVVKEGFAGQTVEETVTQAFGTPEAALAAAPAAADDAAPVDPNDFLNADLGDEDGVPPEAAPAQPDPNTDGDEDDTAPPSGVGQTVGNTAALGRAQPAEEAPPAPQARPAQQPQFRKDKRRR